MARKDMLLSKLKVIKINFADVVSLIEDEYGFNPPQEVLNLLDDINKLSTKI